MMEDSLGAFWIVKDAKCSHTNNEDTDQTARMLICVFVGAHVRRLSFTKIINVFTEVLKNLHTKFERNIHASHENI